MNAVKVCPLCKCEQMAGEFSKCAANKDGLRPYCKPCNSAKTAAWCSARPHYKAWKNMFDRCYNPKHKQYADYGGRGITVCPEWHTYEAYRDYVASLPNAGLPGMSLDRINNDIGYQPDNVRWATRIEQSQNKRLHKNAHAIQSLYYGVSWDTRDEKWRASVKRNGKNKYLGMFDCQNEAYQAVREYLLSRDETPSADDERTYRGYLKSLVAA